MPLTRKKFYPLPYAPKIYVADAAARKDPATYGAADQPLMVGLTTVQQNDDPDATYRLIAKDVTLDSSWEREADYSAIPVEDLLGQHIYDINLAFAEADVDAGVTVTTKPDGLIMTADSTPNATGWIRMALHAFGGLPSGGLDPSFNWNTPTFFILRADLSGAGIGDTDRDTYFQIGRSNTEIAPGQLASRGYGIRRSSQGAWKLFAHDGAVLTEDAGDSLITSEGQIENLVVHNDGDGAVRLFALNAQGRLTLQATISGGPIDGAVGKDVLFECCHINGAAPSGTDYDTLITNAALGAIINPLN